MTPRFAGKLIARILLWPLMLLVALYLILLLINRHDRPPNAAARQLDALYQARTPVADGDNGYLYLLGITHLREHDPVQRQHVASPAWKQLTDGCKTFDRACASLLEKNDKLIRTAVDQEAWMLARYRTLITRSGWQMPLPVDTGAAMPHYATAATGQQLYLFDAYAVAKAGNPAAASAALARDFAFWRMVFAHTDDLMSKLCAAGALKRNLVIGNMVLSQLPRGSQDAAVPAAWRMPFSIQERSLLLPAMGEYLYTKQNLDGNATYAARQGTRTDALYWVLLAPLMQPQDSMNRWADAILARTAALDVDYRDVPAAVARVRAMEDALITDLGFDAIYNPLGKILVPVGIGPWSRYETRGPDLEGVRRAVLLTVTLRSAGVAPAQVADQVAKATLRNPYDGKPFGWDAQSQSVLFTGLDAGERGRNQFVY